MINIEKIFPICTTTIENMFIWSLFGAFAGGVDIEKSSFNKQGVVKGALIFGSSVLFNTTLFSLGGLMITRSNEGAMIGLIAGTSKVSFFGSILGFCADFSYNKALLAAIIGFAIDSALKAHNDLFNYDFNLDLDSYIYINSTSHHNLRGYDVNLENRAEDFDLSNFTFIGETN